MTTHSTALVVKSVPLAVIVIPSQRKRSAHPERVRELARSLAELGLLSPIILSKDQHLVAGLHRLRAAESLGWKEIPAVIVELTTLDAELVEIDENLCRRELTVLERSVQTYRRKLIYEEKYPETKVGISGALASNRKQGRKSQPPFVAVASFVADTTEKTGASTRVIERHVQIAKRIAPEVQARIADTPLADQLNQLEALARVADPAVQARVAELVVAEEAKTVAAALSALQRHDAEERPAAEVVCDELGQEITEPDVAEAYTLLRTRTLEVVRMARAARLAWGHFHDEQEQAERLRILCGRGYSFLRERVEQELKQLTFNIGSGAPYALCPYCKGKPLAKDRRDWCEGCRGGGWVDKSTYDAAPPELQVPSGEGASHV